MINMEGTAFIWREAIVDSVYMAFASHRLRTFNWCEKLINSLLPIIIMIRIRQLNVTEEQTADVNHNGDIAFECRYQYSINALRPSQTTSSFSKSYFQEVQTFYKEEEIPVTQNERSDCIQSDIILKLFLQNCSYPNYIDLYWFA